MWVGWDWFVVEGSGVVWCVGVGCCCHTCDGRRDVVWARGGGDVFEGWVVVVVVVVVVVWC